MIYEIFLIFLSLEVKANVLPKRIKVPDRPYLGLNPPLFRHNPIGVRNIKPGMPLLCQTFVSCQFCCLTMMPAQAVQVAHLPAVKKMTICI